MPIAFQYEVKVAATEEQPERTASLAVRFSPVSLKSPERLACKEPFRLYAVYASEINPPEGVSGICWMLLTTEAVMSAAEAATILRWYTYRWHVEEYHKIIKSGCQVEKYRLDVSWVVRVALPGDIEAAKSMEALLG